MITILVLHAAHSLSRWHHLNRTTTMQSVLEVRPQHGDLRGPYGDPGPAPDCHTFGQLHRSKSKHSPKQASKQTHHKHSRKRWESFPQGSAMKPSLFLQAVRPRAYLKVNTSAYIREKLIYKVNRESYFLTTKQWTSTAFSGSLYQSGSPSKKLISIETLASWNKIGWRCFHETASFV